MKSYSLLLVNKMCEYKVNVSNVGTVIETDREEEARKWFEDYVEISKSEHGRAGNETVLLLKNNDIIDEYNPKNPSGE